MSLVVDIEKNLGKFVLKTKLETQGGVLGLLGASGCGKSFTLKCIAGIEKPDRGRIVLDGVPLFDSEKGINLPPQKRQVGYLFQSYALFPNMTVRQNILCGLHAEKNKAVREQALADAVELMQLQGLEKHRPAQLSGGQQQRVALARILVSKPKLLLLDEPFSALDTHLRDKLQLQMKALLADFGRDVLLVTHSRDEAYHMCNRIAVMDDGRVLHTDDTKALFANPRSMAAALLTGCKNIASAKKLDTHLVEVPEWGLCLHTEQPVDDGLCAVALRAHYFHPKAAKNRCAVEYLGEMEEPFEWVVQFRYAQQSPESAPLWWRVPKDRRPQNFPPELGIAPENVLLLYA